MSPAIDRLANLFQGCRQAGLPLTSQRRTILEVLAERMDHPTVDQVYGHVRERLPGVSKATVYRTLDTLVELDLLRRVDHPGSAARIEPDPTPHHHQLCPTCGRIEDLPAGALEGEQGLALRGGFLQAWDPATPAELSVTVRAVCRPCQAQALSAATSPRA